MTFVFLVSLIRRVSFGLQSPVLVLNRSFAPVRITTARHAFVMLYLERARALNDAFDQFTFADWAKIEPEDGQEWIGTPTSRIAIPRLIVLTTYNRVPRATVRLSRRNIFLRDSYTCQYCGCTPHTRELNLDHVMPRSRGGRSTWENLVTSCRDCNVRKGGATPDECGMLLRTRPVRPTWSTAAQLAAAPRRFAEWEPFLGGQGVGQKAVGF